MCQSDGSGINQAYVTNFGDGHYATQFPLKRYFGDYFEVLFQEDISLIHAITSDIDETNHHLSFYWNLDTSEVQTFKSNTTGKDYTVTTRKLEKNDSEGYKLYELTISHGTETKKVKVFRTTTG